MQQSNCFGIHAVEAFIQNTPQLISHLVVLRGRSDQRLNALTDMAVLAKIEIKYLDKKALQKLTGSEKHQGVALVIKSGQKTLATDVSDILCTREAPFFLVLDEVTDPHNLGACLRSANAAGVDALIIPKNRSATLNATVRKVACGAAESTPVLSVGNLARTLKELKDNGVRIIGAAGEASKTAYDADLTGALALVLGSEGKGLRRLTREHCDQLVSLPMAGSVSSLNVSVAAGVLMFESVRQRVKI